MAGTSNSIALTGPAGIEVSTPKATTGRAQLFAYWKERFTSHAANEEETLAKKERQFVRESPRKLLNYAIWHDSPAGDLAFSMAVGKFRSLGRDEQATIIRKMEKELCYHSQFSFENAAKTRGARVISDFFAEAAETLRKDGNGLPGTSQYRLAVECLESVLSDHSKASPAAARALWNLKYPGLDSRLAPGVGGMCSLRGLDYPACGSYYFWSALLRDSTSRPAAIEKLLEAGPTADVKQHGWDALRLHIFVVGRDIATSKSEKKAEFLLKLVSDSDPNISAEALWSALYLDKITDDFKLAANERYLFYSKRMAELNLALEKPRAMAVFLYNLENNPELYAAVKPGESELAKIRETAAQINPLTTEYAEATFHMSMANEFQIIAESKQAIENTDGKRFEAVSQIISVYLQGRPQLAPMVQGLAQEVSEIMKDAPAETGSRTPYHEKAALAFADLLIVTNPANGNGSRGRMLETLTGMLQYDDERRFYAANALIRLGAEMSARSGIRVYNFGGALFLTAEKGDRMPMRKELAEIAQAMVNEAVEASGAAKARRSMEDREMAARILEALLTPIIPVQVLAPGTDPFVNRISTAWANDIPVVRMIDEAQLPKTLLRDAASKVSLDAEPKMEVSGLPTDGQRHVLHLGTEAARALPPGVEHSRRDAFRLRKPLGAPARR